MQERLILKQSASHSLVLGKPAIPSYFLNVFLIEKCRTKIFNFGATRMLFYELRFNVRFLWQSVIPTV